MAELNEPPAAHSDLIRTLRENLRLGHSRTTSTVLVVDDDEGVAQTFARMLRAEGYQVRTALTAENGLREVQIGQPGAILLDLRMPPGMDGLFFLRRLREEKRWRDIPIAVVTGDYFLEDDVLEELEQLGAELRFKPLWAEDLIGLVRHLLSTEYVYVASERHARPHLKKRRTKRTSTRKRR